MLSNNFFAGKWISAEPTCLMLFLTGMRKRSLLSRSEELGGSQDNPPANPNNWDLVRGIWIRRLVEGY